MTKQLLSKLEWLTSLILTATVIWLLSVRASWSGGLWRDECACVQLALMPTLADIWSNFEHEAFPPVFPSTLRAWIFIFGTGDAAIHAFGTVVTVLLIAALWGSSLLLQSRPPLVGLSLLGLNSSVLIWANTIRGYGLACVWIVITFTMVALARRRYGSGWWLIAALAAVGSVQFALQNSWLILAICVSAALVSLVLREYRSALKILGIGGLSALSVAVYIPRYAGAEWREVVQQSMTLVDHLKGFQFVLGQPRDEMVWVWGILAGLAIMGGMTRLILRRRSGDPTADLLGYGILTLVTSLCFTFGFLLLLSYRPRPWYYLPLLTVVACSLDLVFAQLADSSRGRILRLVFVGALLVWLPRATEAKLKVRLTNLDVAAKILEERAGPDDLIVVSPWYFSVGFNWHYHGETRWETLPILGKLKVHRYDLVRARMISPEPLTDLEDDIEETLKSGHRVWVVGTLMPIPPDGPTVYAPAPNSPVGWNEELYTVSWMEQLAAFMQMHVAMVESVPVPVEGQVSIAEQSTIWSCRGWRR
ncbi:hypothetical protein [Planctomicrobium piriforme]|uniref:hypothetical protein n=1 Tax=Planctomicrobium piriforme TaxID=1576369 RepID=UPI00111436A0|nr:hypothetical protein [Planctomicrobium piriforme]